MGDEGEDDSGIGGVRPGPNSPEPSCPRARVTLRPRKLNAPCASPLRQAHTARMQAIVDVFSYPYLSPILNRQRIEDARVIGVDEKEGLLDFGPMYGLKAIRAALLMK